MASWKDVKIPTVPSTYNGLNEAALNEEIAKYANMAPELSAENAGLPPPTFPPVPTGPIVVGPLAPPPSFPPVPTGPVVIERPEVPRFSPVPTGPIVIERPGASSARSGSLAHGSEVAAKIAYERAAFRTYIALKEKYNQHRLARMSPKTDRKLYPKLDEVIAAYKLKIDKVRADLKKSNPAAYSALQGGQRTRRRRSRSRNNTRRCR